MARRPGKGRSQALWTEAEALERAGDTAGAIRLFVQAALSEEQAGEPMRARLLWERLAVREPVGGPLLERLAVCSDQAKVWDDALDFARAAAVRYTQAGRSADAARMNELITEVEPKAAPHEPVELARPFLA